MGTYPTSVFSLSPEEERELIRRYRDNFDEQALAELVEASVGGAKLVARGVARRTPHLRNELEDAGVAAMLEQARTWDGGGSTFYGYYVDKVRWACLRLRQQFAAPTTLRGAGRMIIREVWKRGISLGELNPLELDALAHELGTTPHTIRALRDRLAGGDVSFDAPVQESEQGSVNGEILQIPSSEAEGRMWRMNPEEILIALEDEDERQAEGRLDLDWARGQLREWIYLLPYMERMVILERYITPTLMAERQGGKVQIRCPEKGNILSRLAKKEWQALEASAIERLKRFVQGDFSCADPEAERVVGLRRRWEKISQTAQERLNEWLDLLPESEGRVVRNRWVYPITHHKRGMLPLDFRNFLLFDEDGRKKKRTGSGYLGLTPQEAQMLEEEAFVRLEAFAAEDFSAADYRMVAKLLSREVVKAFWETMAHSAAKMAIEYVLLRTHHNGRHNKDGVPVLGRGSIKVAARVWRQRMSKELDKDLSKEEAEKELERRYALACKELVAFAASSKTTKVTECEYE